MKPQLALQMVGRAKRPDPAIVPAVTPPQQLHPIAWGQPDPGLAEGVCRSLELAMPVTYWTWSKRHRVTMLGLVGWVALVLTCVLILTAAAVR